MFSTLGYLICIPFALLVKLFYNMTGSYGAAIILFTLAVKLILLPFQIKSKKSMIRMNRMQGRLQDLQNTWSCPFRGSGRRSKIRCCIRRRRNSWEQGGHHQHTPCA